MTRPRNLKQYKNMGSVQEQIECPRCNSENCFDDYYYKTGEELISCPDCGYFRSFFYKRDENGKFIKNDESKGYEFDNLVSEEVHYENPIGAYRISTVRGVSQIGTLVTQEEYDNFIFLINKNIEDENNITEVTVNKFVDGELIEEVIFKKVDNKEE